MTYIVDKIILYDSNTLEDILIQLRLSSYDIFPYIYKHNNNTFIEPIYGESTIDIYYPYKDFPTLYFKSVSVNNCINVFTFTDIENNLYIIARDDNASKVFPSLYNHVQPCYRVDPNNYFTSIILTREYILVNKVV